MRMVCVLMCGMAGVANLVLGVLLKQTSSDQLVINMVLGSMLLIQGTILAGRD